MPWSYELVLESANKAWVTVHQEDERNVAAAPYVDVAVVVLRVQGDGALTLHHVWGGTAERQVPVIVSADSQQQAYCKDMLPGVFHFLVP